VKRCQSGVRPQGATREYRNVERGEQDAALVTNAGIPGVNVSISMSI
jgi:hypothetical protein